MTATTNKRRALPAVSVDVLESLNQHRLLTAHQVHDLHMPGTQLRWTQKLLASMCQHGLVQRATGPHGIALWFLTRHGTETVKLTGTLSEQRRRLTTIAEATGPLRKHTLAVNDTGLAFVKAARERPGDECGPLSWHHEIAHPVTQTRGRHKTQAVIADALLSYLQQAPDESLILHQRFIELDRGTIPAEQLAAKLTHYAQLHRYRPNPAPPDTPDGPLWRARYRTFPAVLIVFADQTTTAVRRRVQRVIALHRSDPQRDIYGTVPTLFVNLTDLTKRGPFAAIFIPANTPDHYENWLGDTNQHQPKREHDAHTQDNHDNIQPTAPRPELSRNTNPTATH